MVWGTNNPILTWPIYAEQQLNDFGMVRELGLAVELRVEYRADNSVLVVTKERERAETLSGGSYIISVGQFIENMISSNV